jgi:YVTN family beta-propeller protein
MKFGIWDVLAIKQFVTVRTRILFCVIVMIAVVSSCDDDDNRPSGEYADGVFVVNEGVFSAGNGSVTHFSDNKVATQNVFGLVNNGRALGDVVQSMLIEDNVGYVVVNNSKKIEVVTASTFESLYTLEGLALPRYIAVDDGFAYVTEWVSFTEPGRVSVVDLGNRAVVDQITVGYGAENILEDDDLLYVSNSFANTVSVIDEASHEVIKTIEVSSSPGELLEDANGKIWVVCGGAFGGNDGALVQIDPSKSKQENAESVIKTIALDMNITYKAAISPDGTNIFYFTDKEVYRLNISDTAKPNDAFIEETNATSFYGVGIDRRTNVLYVADSKGFAGQGTVYRYQLNGDAIDNFTAGIGAGGFAFHD